MTNAELLSKAKSVYGTGLYDDATLVFLFPELQSCENNEEKFKGEEWKVSPDNDRYEVSSMGRVRNRERKNCLRHKVSQDGYHRVCLSLPELKHGKFYPLHRLVANAFIPNPNNLPQVNHIDGNKSNNAASNLEWCTAKENIEHGIKSGLILKGYEQTWAKIKSEDYPIILAMRVAGYPNTDIAKKYNVHPGSIHHFFKRKPYLRFSDIGRLKDEVNTLVSQLPKPQKTYTKWEKIELWK